MRRESLSRRHFSRCNQRCRESLFRRRLSRCNPRNRESLVCFPDAMYYVRKASPDRLYRAALLRNRFVDTILKAQEKALEKPPPPPPSSRSSPLSFCRKHRADSHPFSRIGESSEPSESSSGSATTRARSFPAVVHPVPPSTIGQCRVIEGLSPASQPSPEPGTDLRASSLHRMKLVDPRPCSRPDPRLLAQPASCPRLSTSAAPLHASSRAPAPYS
ncbi:global transcription factor [Cucumis melo var. makuwa]|uniref:Global transcription factor n=1 Tax=Cucumis melo var. makuwa TaxID=1194695 RepID=A0A5D3DKI8_CUCMM|nr:global transcription factor [Cucumis melo var. makuwa]